MHYGQPASLSLSLLSVAGVSVGCILGMNAGMVHAEKIPIHTGSGYAEYRAHVLPGSGDLSAIANTTDSAVSEWLKEECRQITAMVSTEQSFTLEHAEIATSGVR